MNSSTPYNQQQEEKTLHWKKGAIVAVCAGGGIGLYYLIRWIVTSSQ